VVYKIIEQLKGAFFRLELRERRLMLLALIMLVPIVLLFAWLEPMLVKRQALQQRLDRLEREHAKLTSLAQQWHSHAQQTSPLNSQDLESRLRASLVAAGVMADSQLKVLPNRSVVLEATAVRQTELFNWLVDVRRETQSQWADFRIERSTQVDQLKLRIRFVDASGRSG